MSRQNAALHELAKLLSHAGIALDGPAPSDPQVHRPEMAELVLSKGNLGLGESYMARWWDCTALDVFFAKVLRAGLDRKVRAPGFIWQSIRSRLHNRQSPAKAWEVGLRHYDLGNDFFADMLDPYMAYSCGYWRNAQTLEQAQEQKLDLVCRKLGLRTGMRLLDIGCGWGSLMRFAAEHYGVSCVGITISAQQKQLGERLAAGLPIEFRLEDYRSHQGSYDRIASVGMFEHVGPRNYPVYFATAQRLLNADGLMLLHTIGGTRPGKGNDPWIEKYIFPNGQIPALDEIAAAANPFFVIEDLENFGADYDRTLMAWHANFTRHWQKYESNYPPHFYRMWSYYLLSCAGSFRARSNQLWQLVLSPKGVVGGYQRPSMPS